MFTGLVEDIGQSMPLVRQNGGARLTIRSHVVTTDAQEGDSIAANGCCLTVTEVAEDRLSFDLLEETLQRTNFGALVPGDPVNLERALPANGRLGGHFVQGHIDTTAHVLGMEAIGADHRLEIALPAAFARYVAFKGSIAVNGISLTVADVKEESFIVWIIPHTFARTNLNRAATGTLVNLEFDLLAKYLERLITARG